MKRLPASILLGLILPASVSAAPPGMGIFGGKSSDAAGAVKKQDVVQRVTVAGVLIPYRKTVFTAPYAGYIRKIHVKVGETVKAGAPVLTLVQTTGQEGYPMRAPFEGVVTQILRTEGEYVEAGKDSPMVRIDDLTKLYLQSDVPEMEIGKMKKGQEVVVRANAVVERQYKGVIREIAQAARDKTLMGGRAGDRVEFDVRMEILDKDEFLRPGMSAIVDVITAKRENVLALGHEYIKRGPAGYSVTLENGQEREIQVGLKNEELFEITKGLTEKDRVRPVDFYSMGNNASPTR